VVVGTAVLNSCSHANFAPPITQQTTTTSWVLEYAPARVQETTYVAISVKNGDLALLDLLGENIQLFRNSDFKQQPVTFTAPEDTVSDNQSLCFGDVLWIKNTDNVFKKMHFDSGVLEDVPELDDEFYSCLLNQDDSTFFWGRSILVEFGNNVEKIDLPFDKVSAVSAGSLGDYWVYFEDAGLYHNVEGVWTYFFRADYKYPAQLVDIFVDQSRAFVLFDRFIEIYDISDPSNNLVVQLNGPSAGIDIVKDSLGRIWVFTVSGGIWVFENSWSVLVEYPAPSTRIFDVAWNIKNERFYVTTWDGLFSLDIRQVRVAP